MGESATSTVVRQGHTPRAWARNLLSDFDALVERALVAALAGRDPTPFVDDAVRVGADCESYGLCHEHDHKVLDCSVLRRFLELATRAGCPEQRAQVYAGSAKAYVRSRTCDSAKRGLSFSGRPLW